MRVDVQKVLIAGPSSMREAFFSRIQGEGIVEFIRKGAASIDKPDEIQTFIDAFHILRSMVPVKQAAPIADYPSVHVLARMTIENREKLEQLLERKRILQKEIARVSPFGTFSMYELQQIEKRSGKQIQFFFSKHPLEDEDLIHVSSSMGLEYYISISSERREFIGAIEMIIEHSASDLEEQLADVHREIDYVEIKLASMAHHKELLKKGLLHALNYYHLENASKTAEQLIGGSAFATEGWVAENKLPTLRKISDEMNLIVEPIEIEKQDRRPTYLENHGLGRLGQDLIGIYDIPSATDKDPSAWVFFAFNFFFSMIVADAGYGILIFLISLFLYFKFGRKKQGLARRFSLLCLSLSVGCLFWGLMVASFFGIPISPESSLRKVSIIHYAVEKKASYLIKTQNGAYKDLVTSYPQIADAKTPKEFLTRVHQKSDMGDSYPVYEGFTDNILIELAIFVGVVHIMLSFFRYLDRNWSGLGWILFLIGGYLFCPHLIPATSFIYFLFGVPEVGSAVVGLYIAGVGIGLAVVLAVIQRRLAGLADVTHAIGIFTDVMSYLRIYALSLAGMVMGTTANHIGLSSPLYLGVLLLFVGHTVNFTLSVLGAVMHGLRLNFIEWYHYSFEGGGKALEPLKLLEIE